MANTEQPTRNTASKPSQCPCKAPQPIYRPLDDVRAVGQRKRIRTAYNPMGYKVGKHGDPI